MPSSACDWSSDVCSSDRSEEHTSELQSRSDLVCRLLLEKKKRLNSSHDQTSYAVFCLQTNHNLAGSFGCVAALACVSLSGQPRHITSVLAPNSAGSVTDP